MKTKNNNNIKIAIGKRIDFIRLQKNMSKDKFAKLLNITNQHLCQVINGENGLSIEKIIDLSKKTGFPTDFILLGKKISFDNDINNLIGHLESNIEDSYIKIKKMASLIK